MQNVTYSLGVSLDGYIVGPDGSFDFAAIWNPIPKVVFSNTLTRVEGNARLATLGLAGEIQRLRAESSDGDIGIGGATLAVQAAALDLIDEYRPRVNPVLLGGGVPYFPREELRANLELVGSRSFDAGVVALRYRVLR